MIPIRPIHESICIMTTGRNTSCAGKGGGGRGPVITKSQARIALFRASLLVCVVFAIVFAPRLAAQTKLPQSPMLTPGQDLELRKKEIELKGEEVALKKKELSLKEQEVTNTYAIEKWKTFGTIASVIVALFGIAIPLLIAVSSLRAQQKIANEQAKLQFQMKVAELAMTNSNNSTQTLYRAKALATLFETSLLPKNFGDRFDPKSFKFDYGASTDRRVKVIALLAEHPDQRQQILKDWYVLFRWEWWWLEPLLQGVTPDGMDELKRHRELVTANEKRVNEAATQPKVPL